MFSIEQILDGICELFTGPDKLACLAIQLANSIHRSSMLHVTSLLCNASYSGLLLA